jgi:hypothetical protein
MRVSTAEILRIADGGQMPDNLGPGNNLLYYMNDGEMVCAQCATELHRDGNRVKDVYINNAPWDCELCGAEIEGPYEVPEGSEEQTNQPDHSLRAVLHDEAEGG